MIPVLFEAGTKDFSSNGIGRLIDAIKCDVVEERNGAYELELEYPLDGAYFSEITEDRIIYAKPNEKSGKQPFIITEISKAFDGKVTIVAQHIRHLLNKYLVMPFEAASSMGALVEIKRNIVGDDIFVFEADSSITGDFLLEEPKTVMEVLGGGEGSFLDTYHGEYEFDNYRVAHHKNRGSDNGVTIRYGKNMTDLTAKTNTEGVYTGVVPYWTGREVTVTVDENGNEHEEHGEEETIYYKDKVIWSDHVNDYAYKRVKLVDVSDDFVDTKPTDSDFESWARQYFINNSIWSMSNDIEVSFVPLWNSEEYKDIAPLERVGLCDTVTVVYPKLGVENKLKVIKTDYNVLLERYNSIELGEVQSNFRTTVSDIEKRIGNAEIEAARVKSFAEIAIEIQTNLIRGGLGGHVVMKANAQGLPEEILVMDTEDISTAQKVWRWNMGGFAFSNNGYNGPFDTVALTADGQINASTITTGVLNALMIKAGVLTDGIVTYTKFSGSTFIAGQEYFEKTGGGDVPTYELTNDSTPRAGKTYYTQTITANTSFDLATGELKMSKGEINLGKISGTDNYNFTVNDQGQLVARDATIYGTVQSVSNESYYDYKQKKTINYTRKTEIESGQITFYANGVGLGEMYSGFYSQWSGGTIQDAVKYIGVSSEGGLFLRTRGGQYNPYIDLMDGYIDINNDGTEIWINPRDIQFFSSTGSTVSQAMYIDQYGVVGVNQLKLGNYTNAVNFENLWVSNGELGIGTSGGDFWVDDINNAVDYGSVILPTSIRENGEIATYITVRIDRGRIKS